MFYVSAVKETPQGILYGVVDTTDGVVEYYPKNTLLNLSRSGIAIDGVRGNTITVVNMGESVVGSKLDEVLKQISGFVNSWTYETCVEVARRAHFVRKLKGLDDNPVETHRIVLEHLVPDSLKDVINQSVEYTNHVRSVNVSDVNAVKSALKNNLCLALQLGATGKITAFICTGSLNVIDNIYGVGYFENFYLTKALYGYTYNIHKVRPKRDSSNKEKNPNMLSVFSGSLRFDKDGVGHQGDRMVMRSTHYTVNTANLVALYVLDNPKGLNTKYNVVSHYVAAPNKSIYDFDLDMWEEVKQCCMDGTNYFGNETAFMRYVDTRNLTNKVDLYEIMQRFQDDFDFMERTRLNGYSFK